MSPILDALWRDPDAPRVHLFTFEALDLSTDPSSTRRLTACDGADSELVDGELYLPVITEGLDLGQSLLGGDLGVLAASDRTVGTIGLANGDGAFDGWLAYAWAGRKVEVRVGPPGGTALADYALVFTGAVTSVSAAEGEFRPSLGDRSVAEALDGPAIPGTFGGTGGFDGTADMAGQAPLITFGQVNHAPLQLIEPAYNIFALHHDDVEDIEVLAERGKTLAFLSRQADLRGWDPVGGAWIMDHAGHVRLGHEPGGVITAKIKGARLPSYVDTVAGIIGHLMDLIGLGPSDRDQPALDALDARLTGSVGWTGPGSTPVRQIIDEMLAGAGAFRYVTATGALAARLLEMTAPTDTITSDMLSGDAEVAPAPAPVWRLRLGVNRVWRTITEAEVAAGLGDGVRGLIATEWRYLCREDQQIRDAHPRARDVELPSSFRWPGQAGDVIDRLFDLLTPQRHLYQLPLHRRAWRYELGQTVALMLDRFGLDGGRPGIVLARHENTDTGQTLLTVWA